ncbi:hypothetical protein V1477_006446 [Vespula maculifrons]|uniref:Ribosomal protein S3 n=1 Tax=Vespula maculifrons TaxID=7453 RepID=A0ABD2CKT7_VESMC
MEQRKKKFSFYNFFLRLYSTQENRTGVHLGEPEQSTWKGLVAPSTPIFLRTDRTNRSRVITENRTGVVCKASSRPLGPYFSRTDRTNRSRAITHLGEPDLDHWKGLVAPSTLIFSSTRSDQKRTRLGSLERARRALYAHIFLVQHPGEPDRGRLKELVASSTPIFSSTRSHLGEPERGPPRRTRLGSLESARRALYAHIFFDQIGPKVADTYENRTRVTGKGSSRPLRPYFFRPDRTNRSRVITEKRTGVVWKSSSRPLRPYFLRTDRTNRSQVITVYREQRKKKFFFKNFFSELQHLGEPDWGYRKGLVAPSTDIFSSTRSHLGEPDRGRLKELVAPSTPIFSSTRSHLGEPDRGRLKRLVTPSTPIFFSSRSDQEEPSYNTPRRTGPGSFERARRALYAHIFLHLGEPDRGRLKGLVAPSTPIFLCTDRTNRSRVITENQTGVIGKSSSRPLRPYFSRTGWTNRSRVITHPGEPDRGRLKELVASSTPIFSSTRSHLGEPERGPPRRTRLGSLESARRALYAHIFFDQIGPKVADTYENRTRVTGKGSSRPLRPYFFRPDRTNRSRFKVNKGKKHCSLRIFLSETIAPRRNGPGSFERARRVLYAHIFCVQIVPIGAKEQRKKKFFFKNFFSELQHLGEPDWGYRKGLVAPSTDIFSSTRSHLGEPDRGRLKELIAPSTPIFSSTRSVQKRTRLGSLETARRGLYAHIFCVQIGPLGAELYRFKGNKGKKHCCLRIFLSETIAPRRTGPGSIFLSETIAPRRTGPGSFERARRALYAHIFLVQIEPIGADTEENQTGVIGKCSSRPLRSYFLRPDRTKSSRFKGNKGKKHCSLRIFLAETIAPRRTRPGSFGRARRVLYAHIFCVRIGPIGANTYENQTRVTGKGSSRPLRPYFFCTGWTNRSRHLGEPNGGHWKGLVEPSTHIFVSSISDQITYENWSRVSGKGSLRPLRPYFLRRDRTNRSRVITFKGDKGKKHFSLTIFFSETISPRRTGPWSFERARRALYAHIFCVQHVRELEQGTWKGLVAPSTLIFSSTRSDQISYENRSRVSGKGSSSPLRTYFFRPDRTKCSRVITNIGKKHFSLTIFSSETVARTRTGAGYLERARCALYAHIFCVQIGPIGAEIFLSETIAPRRTGPGSFERARRALYAHIFFVQIGPIFKDNKGKKHFSLRIFFSETIAPRRTGPGSFERARRALYGHILFVQIGPIHLGEPDRNLGEPDLDHWKGLVAPSAPIFLSSRSDQ